MGLVVQGMQIPVLQAKMGASIQAQWPTQRPFTTPEALTTLITGSG
jgi:hypothetical protein